jgi:hypothetical protein
MMRFDIHSPSTPNDCCGAVLEIDGISLAHRVRLAQQLQAPAMLQSVLMQYAYYICRAHDIWRCLLEFTPFSSTYDEANLHFARLTKLLRNAPIECFPVLDEVMSATEAICCHFHKYCSTNRPLIANLLWQAEEHIFHRNLLRRQLVIYADTFPESVGFFLKYWTISDAFFALISRIWPRPITSEFSGASPDMIEIQRKIRKSQVCIMELSDLFAYEVSA